MKSLSGQVPFISFIVIVSFVSKKNKRDGLIKMNTFSLLDCSMSLSYYTILCANRVIYRLNKTSSNEIKKQDWILKGYKRIKKSV